MNQDAAIAIAQNFLPKYIQNITVDPATYIICIELNQHINYKRVVARIKIDEYWLSRLTEDTFKYTLDRLLDSFNREIRSIENEAPRGSVFPILKMAPFYDGLFEIGPITYSPYRTPTENIWKLDSTSEYRTEWPSPEPPDGGILLP